MTSKHQREVDEVVYWLSKKPRPSHLVASYMDSSRIVNVLRENVSALEFTNSSLRITPAFMNVLSSMFDGMLKTDVEKILRILESRTMYPKSLTTPMNVDITLVK
jgi:hypothetical protein